MKMPTTRLFGVVLLATTPAFAQQMDHSKMDHSKMDHAMPGTQPDAKPQAETAIDHSTMDHSTMDHSTMDNSTMDHSTMDHSTMDHSTMDHAAMGHATPSPSDQSFTPIPVPTDADRAAAVPPSGAHALHGTSRQFYVLLDRLEAFDADPGSGQAWAGRAWMGGDLDRLWLRSEGERVGGQVGRADFEVLYGRAIARWWDVVAGMRHDFKPGAARDFVAVGVQGLAPHKLEVAATAYLGQSGQAGLRLEVEYETRLTERWILQPLVELEFHGKDDARRGIGSGLGTAEAGLRLRYEVTRQFAPYVGIVQERAFGRTAGFRRASGHEARDTHLVAGIRFWF